jgi:hypothetical protein
MNKMRDNFAVDVRNEVVEQMITNYDNDEINPEKYPFDAGLLDFFDELNRDLADGVLLVDLPEHLELYNRYWIEGQGLNGNSLCMVEGWDFAYAAMMRVLEKAGLA